MLLTKCTYSDGGGRPWVLIYTKKMSQRLPKSTKYRNIGRFSPRLALASLLCSQVYWGGVGKFQLYSFWHAEQLRHSSSAFS
jgi:hypothetical protein